MCLMRGADLHITQLIPLPLTVSCFSKIQIGFTFLVPAHTGSPGQGAVKRVCVCVCVEELFVAGPSCQLAERQPVGGRVVGGRWHGDDAPVVMARRRRLADDVAVEQHDEDQLQELDAEHDAVDSPAQRVRVEEQAAASAAAAGVSRITSCSRITAGARTRRTGAGAVLPETTRRVDQSTEQHRRRHEPCTQSMSIDSIRI